MGIGRAFYRCLNTDRCSRSRSVATMPWASSRGCSRCRSPPATMARRRSGCSGCCCCYRCCYRSLRCQLVMQPTKTKTRATVSPPRTASSRALFLVSMPDRHLRFLLCFNTLPLVAHALDRCIPASFHERLAVAAGELCVWSTVRGSNAIYCALEDIP